MEGDQGRQDEVLTDFIAWLRTEYTSPAFFLHQPDARSKTYSTAEPAVLTPPSKVYVHAESRASALIIPCKN